MGAWSRLGGRASVGAALALYAAIYAFRLIRGGNAVDAADVLLTLPLVLLALRFGTAGGLLGAMAAIALIAVWGVQDQDRGLDAVGYACWGGCLVLLGLLIGSFVEHRRKLEAVLVEAERREAEHAALLERAVAERTRDLEQRTRDLEDARAKTLKRLALAAEFRDDDTFAHTERVGATAAEIAAQLGWDGDRVAILRLAAPLHDVGKIGIDDSILRKPGRFTAEEFEAMKAHTDLGARLLESSGSPILQLATVIARSHHERWDGMGYPAGLSGEAIPLAGRIVAVADVFDALTHERPYKAAWSLEDSLAEIRRGAGTHFDPRVVDAFFASRNQPDRKTPRGRGGSRYKRAQAAEQVGSGPRQGKRRAGLEPATSSLGSSRSTN